MSNRYQRLLLIILSITLISIAIFLILFNSKKNLIFFYTPSEFHSSNVKINEKVRIGGFVKEGSILQKDGNLYEFIITDNDKNIYVSYKGVLPDLFREGQGAVIEGSLIKNNYVLANTIFAKHDENYIPATLKNQLKKTDYWKKEYE
jgi:cytochrome c-type biogenesis protein CcmE